MAWPSERSRDGGIDEIPFPHETAGRLFLCGKHAIGPDVEALLARVDATTVVCLTERRELADRFPDYVDWLAANSPERAIHRPIPDMHVPSEDAFAALIDEIAGRLAEGERVIVHCAGGYGRSGTVAAGLLVRSGMALADALELVRTSRPMAGPEVGAQADALKAYERRQRGDVG